MKFFKFITKWSELITIPVALFLWWLSPGILRALDPTSGLYDAGIFQIILFGIIAFFILSGVVWIYLKITFPKVYKYLDDVLGANLEDPEGSQNLTKWQKSKIVLLLFSVLLLSLVLLTRAI